MTLKLGNIIIGAILLTSAVMSSFNFGSVVTLQHINQIYFGIFCEILHPLGVIEPKKTKLEN